VATQRARITSASFALFIRSSFLIFFFIFATEVKWCVCAHLAIAILIAALGCVDAAELGHMPDREQFVRFEWVWVGWISRRPATFPSTYAKRPLRSAFAD
jgi:hypothetical protein